MPNRKDHKTRKLTPLRKRNPDGDVTVIDVNDIEFLKRYVGDQGKITPRRMTGLKSVQQRKVKKGVRRARAMGLMA